MVWAQSRRKPTILFLATCHEDTEILARDRSIHEGNFLLYVDTLTQLEWLFHALDHYNYARAISVHLRDMMMLQDKHPDVYAAFCEGKFTVNKTCRPFSRMALDESHEQNNASVKGDGGAVGLTEKPAAVLRWMVAGPELARVVGGVSEETGQERKYMPSTLPWGQAM